MPGPFPLRGLQPVHQSRFPSLDDEKVSVSLSSPPLQSASSSSLPPSPPSTSVSPPLVDHNSVSMAQKNSRAEVRRAMQEAIARGFQPPTDAHIPKHKLDDVHTGSPKPSRFSTRKVDDTESACMPTHRGDNLDVGALKRRHAFTHALDDKGLQPAVSVCGDEYTPLQTVNNNHDQFVCMEIAGQGAQWRYTLKKQSGMKGESAFNVVNLKVDHNPLNDLVAFVRSCLVPEGFPESVSPSYTPYMRWRALKYLFGGAMSVFTTRSLLHAVGVSRHGAATTAMAVNWVIKDGAGRVGKLLFARHGKKFDYDMKQLRFTGDLLMELGAAVELATVAAPHFFLPLACAANIAKNVAAVASTSTRAPIYKAFARGENIGDVTAKGECISNIADLLGTGLGIFISKKNPSLMVTFAVLSCGYLCCSYNEIKSVCLSTLNRARFEVAVQFFLETGRAPSLREGNQHERIFTLPWTKMKPFALGARVNEAFQSPYKFLNLLPLFQEENYMVTYNPIKGQAFALLKEKASSDDVLKATFHVMVLEYILKKSESSWQNMKNLNFDVNGDFKSCFRPDMSVDGIIRESCKAMPRLFETFRESSISQGWVMGESLLSPGSARLCT
ncbi:hypothetical protein GOP47_0014693 [Adiantum capillus-veneris]|uniref:Protein root UVB sensitive 6 n=1 Tax=Adiantum capillus-veneris TaxID=13818 RepID=A0A9D4ULZ5_ADICA|nr:hypothetical protein GOP47_0014693 [Adiantum capillus-veneris]